MLWRDVWIVSGRRVCPRRGEGDDDPQRDVCESAGLLLSAGRIPSGPTCLLGCTDQMLVGMASALGC